MLRTMTAARRQRWLASLWILGFSLLIADTADAARVRPALLFLEGYVGEAPAGVRPQARLVLQYQGQNYNFDLTRTGVKSGNRSSGRLLQDIRPFQNTLILRGSAASVAALTSASPGQKLRISGYHQSGSRELNVSETRTEPASPTPAAH